MRGDKFILCAMHRSNHISLICVNVTNGERAGMSATFKMESEGLVWTDTAFGSASRQRRYGAAQLAYVCTRQCEAGG